MRGLFTVTGLITLAITRVCGAGEPATFDQAVAPFFKENCSRCHGAKKQKGDFRLDTLPRDFADDAVAQRWAEVMFRMNAGEMPPKKEAQPTPEALGRAVGWISSRLDEGRAARMARRGPVAHYRLSRDEYANTIYDLLGVYYDVNLPGAFNDDPRWHGFERIGSMLTLSPSHVERYFKAAETVLERAYPDQPPATVKGRSEPKAGNRWLLFPGLRHGNIRPTAAGWYRIRIQLSALPSFKGRMPHLALWHDGLKRSIIGQDVIAPEEKPTIVEIQTFLPEGGLELMNEAPGMLSDGQTLSQTDIPFVSTKDRQFIRPTGYKLFDDDGKPIFPLLIVDWVEWEGPILSDADRKKRENLVPAKNGDVADARECLNRFATRAWRRPATEAEVDRFMKVMDRELAAGENFRSAYMAAMVGVLTSKNFYYIEEGSATRRRDTVSDWELASRLSYFLWGSMPDDALFAVAKSGALHEPAILRAQLARMTADGRIKRFTDAFPRQWLQLYKVGMFPPDPELYPDYDKWLEKSMLLETVGYFTEVFGKNLSLREFISSNWTVLNSRLAMHYHMPPLTEPRFQRVSLRPEDHRGGLLTQAAILTLTSDGTRHRPVHRGVWVSEAIFGKTPPPPPPNVQPIEPLPNDKPKATVRMQLEDHVSHPICASCHNKIDSLGFAFDNYDAIGQWRTEEVVPRGMGANPPVNASGTMADGRPYDGPDEFKRLMAQDVDRFAGAFVEQLATFALRRAMTIDDAAQIRAIAQASKADDYRLQTVIENFVMSDLFQKR
ncbi:MAG TPA: DUF1592 domain-containing protein [Tepidisphaeraceae bacterium]|jgi:hypothetical protein|nr:DUF1592 domain-containing protein [Tepidisphaeraceae bacterium]